MPLSIQGIYLLRSYAICIHLARTLGALRGEQRGYKFSRHGEGQLAITIDPHIFFGKAESCLHRPTRVNWSKPKKALHTPTVPIADGGSPTASPLTVETVKEEAPPVSQADSGTERMEKELAMMQMRLETLRAEFKAAIQKVHAQTILTQQLS